MPLDLTQDLLNPMIAAAEGLGGTIWTDMKIFALPELQKIAGQIAGIETDLLQIRPPHSQDAAAALLDMQMRATIGVVIAMTALTLLAVQNALNQIMDAIKTTVNTAVGFALIA